MTKSTITIERLEKIKSWREAYGAGSNVMLPAEEAEELARMALAAMDSEPVAYMYRDNLHSDARFSLESKIGNWSPEDINEYEISETPLYRHAQQPVVPEEMTAGIAVKHWQGGRGSIESFVAGCNFFRAAMLNGGNDE